ncbi:MAG: hypothetical protein LBM98_12625 [Oscillospiraceae bacterium]|nr:hypothetical protein [Oscillospiraceae bacterium]
MRYVGRLGAKQSSAGSVTYVSADCGYLIFDNCYFYCLTFVSFCVII